MSAIACGKNIKNILLHLNHMLTEKIDFTDGKR